MAIKLTTAIRTDLASMLITKIDASGAAGRIVIYGGTKPSGPDVAQAHTALSEHTLAYPCGAAANGLLTFGAIAEDAFANATGTATWARFYTSANAAVADASISVQGGSGDLQMNTVAIVENGPVRFTTVTWTMPGA